LWREALWLSPGRAPSSKLYMYTANCPRLLGALLAARARRGQC